jgi:predicted ribosomally synthesized peptide with nif11-like leader
MSKQGYIRFRGAVMKSASLQAELANNVKSQADLLAMGKRLGFEFDAADLASPELTEEELRHVAGGATTLAGAGVPLDPLNKWAPVSNHEKWIDVLAFNAFVNTFPK